LHLFIILLPCVWFEHPGHTYGGFVPYFSERGMTITQPGAGPIYWWPNLMSLEKSDYMVSNSGPSSFSSFRTTPRKEINSKIWRSKVFWGLEKDYKVSRSKDGINPIQKLMSQKPYCTVLDSAVSGFPRTDSLVRVWDIVCLGKIFFLSDSKSCVLLPI
jgi:hypothetical protein